jgi:hypothetical protein
MIMVRQRLRIKRDWTKPTSRDKTDPNDATAIESKRRTNFNTRARPYAVCEARARLKPISDKAGGISWRRIFTDRFTMNGWDVRGR